MASTPGMAATILARSTASAVEFEVAPATIGTRRATTSMVISMTRSHSSRVSVGVSPVVPHGTRKSIFDSTCQATSERRAFSSTEPSPRNGVTIAVPHPRKFMRNPREELGIVYGKLGKLTIDDFRVDD